MMKCQTLYSEFRKFQGQPVTIYTDDHRVYSGIDMEAYENAVRILDDCNRPILIEYSHIDAVVEPQMRLRECCQSRCDRCDRCDMPDISPVFEEECGCGCECCGGRF